MSNRRMLSSINEESVNNNFLLIEKIIKQKMLPINQDTLPISCYDQSESFAFFYSKCDSI